MFGLSWDQIILILLAALFLLGPERIPTAVKWVMESLRKVRTMAAGAQEELRSQIGPELDELRRQVAELQSLKELNELRALRDLNPRNIIGKQILGDQFSGGVSGFLGLNGLNGTGGADASGGSSGDGANGSGGDGVNGAAGSGSTDRPAGVSPGSTSSGGAGSAGSAAAAGTMTLTATRAQRTLEHDEVPPFDDEGT